MNGSPTAPPAFNGQRGFFPIDENRLVAYDLTGGTELWTVPRSIGEQPATGGGLVFVVDARELVALRETDGSLAWRQPFSELPATSLVWDNGWLVATTTSGTILTFRASDGELIWSRTLGARASARPALAADRVYVPVANGRVIAMRVEDGTPLWERRIGGTPNEMLALDDRVYVGSEDNYLYCLKTDAGVIDWRWRTGADVVARPLADEHRVYFVSLDNLLRALDRGSGNQLWKRTLPLRPTRGPVPTGDTLIVSGVAPSLRMYSMRDGSPAGDVATEGELASAPYVLPETETPTLIVVTRHLEKGAMLSALTRSSEPAPAPAPESIPVASPKP